MSELLAALSATLLLLPRKPVRQAALDTLESLKCYLTNRSRKNLPLYHSKTANSNHTRHSQATLLKVEIILFDNLVKPWKIVPHL